MTRPKTLHQTLPGVWHVVHAFTPYTRREWPIISLSMLALLAQVAFRLLEPWPLSYVIDHVITPRLATTLPGAQPQPIETRALLILGVAAGIVVLLAALRAAAGWGATVGFALAGNRVLARVRSDLYSHLQSLSLSFHTGQRAGDITVRVISDVGTLRDVVSTALLPLLGNVLVLAGMLAVMFWLNFELALLGLATLPLFWLRSSDLGARIQSVSRVQRQQEGAIAATASEALSAIRVVKALSLERVFAASFEKENAGSLKEGVKAKRLEASLERTVDVLIAISTGLVLWFGATLVLRAEMTVGELLVFLTYLKSAFRPVRDMAKYTSRLAKASAAGERILDIFNEQPEVRDRPDAVPAPALRGALSFQRVSFGYQPNQLILHDVNVQLSPGTFVALVGPSGNGKSTMLNLLLRLYDPTAGSVRIDGRDIRDFTMESVRGQISVVMQDPLLFAASIEENIAYGAPNAGAAQIEVAARLANAHDFISALPDGYATVLSERGATLSMGQRQRIAIARAAVRRAPILLLDEPTTGLDEENARAVSEALERLARGCTTLMVTHDLAAAARADLILYLEHGRIVEQGNHLELVRADGRYAHLYRLQAVDRAARQVA